MHPHLFEQSLFPPPIFRMREIFFENEPFQGNFIKFFRKVVCSSTFIKSEFDMFEDCDFRALGGAP